MTSPCWAGGLRGDRASTSAARKPPQRGLETLLRSGQKQSCTYVLLKEGQNGVLLQEQEKHNNAADDYIQLGPGGAAGKTMADSATVSVNSVLM